MTFFWISLGFLLLLLLLVLFIRALRLKPNAAPPNLPKPDPFTDEEAVARFQAILRKKTVWPRNLAIDYAEFDSFLPTLRSLYPRVFDALTITTVNRYGILLKWKGRSAEKQPVVLMAHYDVVSANAEEWTYPPFAAEVHDGAIWARGSIDTKCIIGAVLEAVNHLLKGGFVPERDIYFSLTNNEETGGDTTPHIVQWFIDSGITPWFVLDEGGAVVHDLPLGIHKEFAMIGVSEKGVADVILTAAGEGGHSSTPSPNDSTARLIAALRRINTRPFQTTLTKETAELLKRLAAYAPFGYRLVFANLWLFAPIVKMIMSANGETNAMLRTTAAVTQLSGSDTINTLPKTASAGLSVRIAPTDSVETAVEALKKAAAVKLDVKVAYKVEPSPVSDYHSSAFGLIADTVRSVYPGADAAPFVMNGGTDSKHFAKICRNVYRFGGFALTADERKTIHAADERLPIDAYYKGITFYIQLIRALNQQQ